MRALALLLLFSLGCTTTTPARVAAAASPDISLPTQVVNLENGLTLLMQPDPTMPLVGVEVWIRGGGRDEAPGQHGIAHLFEHNVPSSGRFASNPENRTRRAAASRNGGAGTQYDYLRFYSHAAPEGLEAVLAAHADRLESDPAKFTDEAVRRDQDIVIRELRRSMRLDWDPEVMHHLQRGTFGADHPYGHAIAGSEAEVRSATAETMREWHRRFSNASNAIVFLVGNFDPAVGERLVRHHFGSIPAGQRAPKMADWVPAVQARREVIEKDVERGAVYLRWPVPAWGTADADYLRIAAEVLDHRLEDGTAAVELHELAGTFTLRGDEESEPMLRDALERLLRDGIPDADLARAKTRLQTDFVRTLQRPVWRDSRADVLGFGLMWRGDASHYKKQLARLSAATPTDVRDAARRWLTVPGYTLQVVPKPKRVAAPPVDRAATVSVLPAQPVRFPAIQSSSENGVRVLKAERNTLPLTELTFAFDRGTDVGALRTRIAEALGNIGATAVTAHDADFAALSVSVLNQHANEATRIVLNGAAAASAAESQNRRAAEPAETPLEQRDRTLECLIADCAAERTASSVPRAIIASGDVAGLELHGLSGTPPDRGAPTPLRAPDNEQFRIIDYPAARQAHLLLAQVLPPNVARDPLPAQVVIFMLRQRLMNNLRSSKGWSYEVYPFGVELRRDGALARYNMPVQTDKLAESVAEVRKEIARLRDGLATAEELAAVRGYVESTLTGGLLSLDELNPQLLELARNDLPLDYFATAIRRLATFTPEDVQTTAREILHPDRLIWIIAAPREAAERELAELGGR